MGFVQVKIRGIRPTVEVERDELQKTLDAYADKVLEHDSSQGIDERTGDGDEITCYDQHQHLRQPEKARERQKRLQKTEKEKRKKKNIRRSGRDCKSVKRSCRRRDTRRKISRRKKKRAERGRNPNKERN